MPNDPSPLPSFPRSTGATEALPHPIVLPSCCLVIARHLARHGMPASRIARIINELAEHWEDLRAEACERGLPGALAELEADRRLGDPARLAANAVAGLRQRSFLGRHPIFSVCLVPLVLPLLLMSLVFGIVAWLEDSSHFIRWAKDVEAAAPYLIPALALIVHYGAAAISLAWLSWRAWVRGLGFRWVVALSAWCALASLIRHFEFDPIKHVITLGLQFSLRLNRHTVAFLLMHAVPVVLLFSLRRDHKPSEFPEPQTAL
ncbi:MAG TPA: hypothetical protein VK633_10765 [Verrucomicrobiae bacterium]|nr:hypothetical protein [Verrucomicrobiae bacterium]